MSCDQCDNHAAGRASLPSAWDRCDENDARHDDVFVRAPEDECGSGGILKATGSDPSGGGRQPVTSRAGNETGGQAVLRNKEEEAWDAELQ